MELIDYLKSQLLIEQARAKARATIWGPELEKKYCADDLAVIAEIERQIYELEEGI